MNMKKQLLITTLLLISGSLWAMEENDSLPEDALQRHGELTHAEFRDMEENDSLPNDSLPEDALQRKGILTQDEFRDFDYFCKNCRTLTIDQMKEIREKYPHFYQWATPNGDTVLHHLIRSSQNTELLRFVLSDGADPYHRNKKNGGEDAFGEAVRNKPMLKVLLAHYEIVSSEEYANASEEERKALLASYNSPSENTGFPGKTVLSFAAGAFLMYFAKTTFDKYYSEKK